MRVLGLMALGSSVITALAFKPVYKKTVVLSHLYTKTIF